MAASPKPLPWFETARIAAKWTRAAPAMARLLTMRPSVLNACQIPRLKDSQALRVTVIECHPWLLQPDDEGVDDSSAVSRSLTSALAPDSGQCLGARCRLAADGRLLRDDPCAVAALSGGWSWR